MTSNIRAEIVIGAPGDCPIAQAAADTETPIKHIARSSTISSDSRVTEEFALTGKSAITHSGVEPVFKSDTWSVYQFDRDQGRGCVCEYIERYGCPVSDLHAQNGALIVSFHAPDIDTIQDIVTDLHEGFDDIQIRRLIRTDEQTEHNFVLMDREQLTEKQQEVLKTSYEMGYFDHPKGANAGEVAEALGIAPSTFSEHMAAAQEKIVQSFLKT